MPKEDCKYWDKCYQKNDYHLNKYNHPPIADDEALVDAEKKAEKTESESRAVAAATAPAQKRKPSQDEAVVQSTSEATNGDANKAFDTTELRKEVLGNIAGKNYMEILQKRIKLSEQSEYDDLLRTNEFIRHKFLVEMPPDFYAFWKFVCELKPDQSGDKVLEHFNKQFQIKLVGAFEFLAGNFHKATIREPGDYLRHWRFFYDPPEFQTIFVCQNTGIHYGYWRDMPKDKDGLLIARNDAGKGCEFEFVAGNAFDAFLYFLEKDFKTNPFTAATVANAKKSLQKFIDTNEVKVEKLETLVKQRTPHVVARTFHRAGIVVPYDAKTQVGYRGIIVSDAELKNILDLFNSNCENDSGDEKNERIKIVMAKLQPVATAASIALDESDFGTSLELGIDLFCSGHSELDILVQSLLVSAYTLLNRPQFIAISKAHMEKRKKDFNLSIFDLDHAK